MILQYQATSIEIRDPKLGNTETIQSNAIVRENRNGDILGIDDWQHNTILRFDIETMRLSEKSNFETFLKDTAGREITIIFQGTWLGVIITPIIDIITMRDLCSYDASFEFQGRKL